MKTNDLNLYKEKNNEANLQKKDFNLNQPQEMFSTTNNLTNPNAIDLTLNSIYFSNRCKFFYVLLIIPSIITLFFLIYFLLMTDTKEVPLIIVILEWLLNTIIVLDILLRIKIMGFYKFLRIGKIDFILTILCILSFLFAMISLSY